ncbi:MAG: cofactor-independent phosphoglycerate mutase [Victivallaceae bacterium]|nr:cofactor-independent phosphoglycerate mutase [Victivallaceae bacterium]
MAKAIIFLPDGMADLPLASLDGKTPLEAVDTPSMDSIARNGANGTFLTLPEGLPTSSDVANMSVLGFYPEKNYPGRGPIEAVSQGIELGPDDVAWRCNLVRVSPEGKLLDYSAGHIENTVSSQIMRLLQENFGSDKVSFHPGVSYRNLMVLHGREFSDKVSYEKPDSSQGEMVVDLLWKPLDASPEARHTADFVVDLFERTAKFLKTCPVKSEATHIWPWSPGYLPKMASFQERYAGKTGAIISAVDVIQGIGKCAGMDIYKVEGATGFIDTNYAGKVAAALKALETHDLVYLHVEAIDECSHLGDLRLKMRAIRDFDQKIVAPVLEAIAGQDVNIALLPDHPVPIELRKHTTTPVPLAIMGKAFEPDAIQAFSEKLAPQGSLGHLAGDQLVRKLLGL